LGLGKQKTACKTATTIFSFLQKKVKNLNSEILNSEWKKHKRLLLSAALKKARPRVATGAACDTAALLIAAG
jgi:hypothetical protein